MSGSGKSPVSCECRAWAITRGDGVTLGFTDHDRDFTFEGIVFRAGAGLTGSALAQTTGLAVDNGEATGALSSFGLTESDIEAGHFDGADVRVWTVPWSSPEARRLEFRGTIGAITRHGGEFRAELRGLTEQLNVVQGRIFHRSCSAVLGDKECGVDLTTELFSAAGVVNAISGEGVLRISMEGTFEDGWFENGTVTFVKATFKQPAGVIIGDEVRGDEREITLLGPMPAGITPGARLRFLAGCDRCPATCQGKFDNFSNFRGFPHIPGEDWLMSVPRRGDVNDGGSLIG